MPELGGSFLSVSCGKGFEECGLRNTAGSDINYGHLEYPWHVAIYKEVNAAKPPKYEYLCGGSIIHQKLILTVARFVYDENTSSAVNGNFIVVAGKYNSSFDFRGPTEQRLKVIDIKIPEVYFGHHTRYTYNIAVLTLNESIKFSDVVMPVCIDWNSEVHQTLTVGTVVGWGLTENNVISTELAAAKIDYYNITSCREKVEKEFIRYVTSDTFCSAPSNSTAVQVGSFGGGFVFPLNSTKNLEKYFLHGIISLKERKSNITVYTNVTKHLSWLISSLTSVTSGDLEGFDANYGDYFKECGMRYAVKSNIPTVNYGFEAKYTEYPWHVALYRQFSSTETPEYICGGSIVHRKLILTAAHCFYDDSTFDLSTATFTAITGKYHRSWDRRDNYEQRFKVIEIKIPITYRSFLNRYSDDIAVLVLNETIRFSSVVMPVCIDWNPGTKAQDIPDTGTVVGWGLTENSSLSDILLVAKLKTFNFTACNNKMKVLEFAHFITSDKFCAGLKNGTAVDQGDSGGGLAFLRDSIGNKQQYYIRGIVSTKDRTDNSIATFTDINKHLNWLNTSISPFIGSEYCPTLISSPVELALCKFNGTSVNCNRPARTGTTAKVLCNRSFHSGFPFKLYTETECLKNLSWSPLLESCIECGKRYRFNNFAPAVIYKPRNVSEFPWHIAIYKKNTMNETKYICGGTIIHPKAVLTAAHCITDVEGKEINAELFFIAAGKYKSGWNIKDPFEQRLGVSKIYLRSTYSGLTSLYADDIAVLELNGTISLSDYIMPACIDWTGKLKLHKKPFLSALSPGWGLNEQDNQNVELRTANLLFVNLTSCYDLITEKADSYLSYLSPDKWCGISQDGSISAKGDSGGSLAFPRYEERTGEQTYYIYGLLSIKPHADILGITDVLFHKEWIKDVMMSIINNSESNLNN